MLNPSHRWLQMIIFCCGCLLLLSSGHAENHWKTIAPGIDYLDLESSLLTPWSHVHVFKINLRHNRLKLGLAKHLQQPHASVEALGRNEHALIAINGGFFDKKYQPLGLRASEGQRMNPLKNISWWGVFYTRRLRAFIASPKQYIPRHGIDFAIQSGPRLVVNGVIPSLKPGRAQRTAMGIDRQGNVLILVTENVSLNTEELAQRMKNSPLNCKHALNLDGGSSTQLVVNLPNFNLNVHGFSNVSDAVLVVPRT